MSSNRYGYPLFLFFLVFIAMGVFCPRPLFADVCSDGVAFPPFVSKGLDANLLMIIDNSASMYDLAYVPEFAAQQGYCYDDTYDNTKTYAGYFESDTVQWYIYNTATEQFETDDYANVKTQFDTAVAAGGTVYKQGYNTSANRYLRVVIKENADPDVPNEFMFFAATGNFLNWAAASKFDVEKKVLTGGKYDSGQLIMESRGCMDRTFVKKVLVYKGNDTSINYYLTLGIISEPDAASGQLTRIEIYNINDLGFQAGECENAIDEFSDPAGELSVIKDYTKSCLSAGYEAPLASTTSFNHILQECWYYNAHGVWQPGAGTITSLMSDCQNVYAGTFDTGQPPYTFDNAAERTEYLEIDAPDAFENYPDTAALNIGDVCYGRYGTSQGYVGRCWEPTYESGFSCTNEICDPATDSPLGNSASTTQPAAEVCTTDTHVWIFCNGNYNANTGKCNGKPGTWDIKQNCVGTGDIQSVNWTDDDPGTYLEGGALDPFTHDVDGKFTSAENCVDRSLKKWCANVEDPGVVDPTDAMSSTGTTYNVPAILIDYALESQLGAPLLTMKGLIQETTAPTGLLHEYQVTF